MTKKNFLLNKSFIFNKVVCKKFYLKFLSLSREKVNSLNELI